jgi:hypothetical protein
MLIKLNRAQRKRAEMENRGDIVPARSQQEEFVE